MSFSKMGTIDLRRYINGCHAARAYDSSFEAACRELNNRIDVAQSRASYGSYADDPAFNSNQERI